MVRIVSCAALLAVFALGCGKKKADDCQRLVQAIGPQHASLTAAYGRSDQTPEDLEAQAVGWDKAAQEIAALAFENDEVKGLATQFSGILTKAAKIRRDMAVAARNTLDPAGAIQAQSQAVAFMVEETKAKASLDMACR